MLHNNIFIRLQNRNLEDNRQKKLYSQVDSGIGFRPRQRPIPESTCEYARY